MSSLKNFKGQLPRQENLYSFLTGKKISGKEYEHVLTIWNKFEMVFYCFIISI